MSILKALTEKEKQKIIDYSKEWFAVRIADSDISDNFNEFLKYEEKDFEYFLKENSYNDVEEALDDYIDTMLSKTEDDCYLSDELFGAGYKKNNDVEEDDEEEVYDCLKVGYFSAEEKYNEKIKTNIMQKKEKMEKIFEKIQSPHSRQGGLRNENI